MSPIPTPAPGPPRVSVPLGKKQGQILGWHEQRGEWGAQATPKAKGAVLYWPGGEAFSWSVSVGEPSNGDVLTWNEAEETWEPKPASGGGLPAGERPGQTLYWDETSREWVLTGGFLDDEEEGGSPTGSFLFWNSTFGEWVHAPADMPTAKENLGHVLLWNKGEECWELAAAVNGFQAGACKHAAIGAEALEATEWDSEHPVTAAILLRAVLAEAAAPDLLYVVKVGGVEAGRWEYSLALEPSAGTCKQTGTLTQCITVTIPAEATIEVECATATEVTATVVSISSCILQTTRGPLQ